MRFGIFLVVTSIVGVPQSKFSFQPIPALEPFAVDVARDDILQNYMSKADQLMNGRMPWCRAREKSTLFMQMLIQSSSPPGDVVLDCSARTGNFLNIINFSNFILFWLSLRC